MIRINKEEDVTLIVQEKSSRSLKFEQVWAVDLLSLQRIVGFLKPPHKVVLTSFLIPCRLT